MPNAYGFIQFTISISYSMKKITLFSCWLLAMATTWAQGPPITIDKPIMLGGKSFTVKTLTEIRKTNRGNSTYLPVMLHYLPTANTLLAIHLPVISSNLSKQEKEWNIADIVFQAKYQFYRKDQTGKTFRVVAKTLQTLPTGAEIDVINLSTGKYQGYYGLVSGYETLKYGISSELGYNWSSDENFNEWRTKLGFGLPLLKPQYPNKQINLFFEYTSQWLTHRDWYQLLYSQGVQLALKNVTFEASIQFPLINDFPESRKLQNAIFIGSRYTF